MTLSKTRRPESPERSSVPPLKLHGLDLTRNPRWRGELWPDGMPGMLGEESTHLSADGFASPMGFRFCVPASPDEPGNALRVTVHDRSDRSAIARARSRRRTRSTLVRTVSVPAPNPRHGELTLVIGTEGADVFASEAAWEALAEPVLLIIAQYARYGAVEQRLLAMQDQACRDHRHTATAGLRTLRERGRLVRAACDVRDLVSDWTYFAGPVADPRRPCSSQEALEACTALAEALDIDAWAEAIDEIASDVEQTYGTISDRLFEYRLFMWGMVMEVIIIGLIIGLIVH